METQTEQLYRTLVENVPLVVYAWTVEPGAGAERVLIASGQIEAMLEISPEEAEPGRVLELVHPDDRERVASLHVEANRFQRALSLEYRLITPSGRTIWARDESQVVTSDEGEIHRHGYLIDISVQREAELETTEALLRAHAARVDAEAARADILSTIEKMSDGFFAFDSECRFRCVNTAGAALVGKEVHELLGEVIWDAFPVARTTAFGRALLRAQAGQQVALDDYRSPVVDGPIAEVRAYPSADGVWVFIRDMTERRRLEESLRHSQKMEAVGQLAGGIAHDFNNILTAITGYADFALRDVEGEPDLVALRREIEEIKRVSGRATDLTRQLLAFSRHQVLERRTLDLNNVVRSSERLLRRLIGAHVTLILSTETGPTPVEADGAQLEQVVVNLALNARDAMPDGGTLTIRTHETTVSPGDAALLGVPDGPYFVLSVGDTGIGMSEELRSQIFEPFFTTKPTGEGTGLGLSTVYGIVRQSGGAIDLESEVGTGSTFRVYLPASADAVPIDTPAPAHQNQGSERVLLVEDNPVLRELITEMLCRKGYDVVVAPDPAAAVALHEEEGLALLITDVSMPGMSGVDLAEALRRRDPRLGVLLISGYERTKVDENRLVGNVQFLSKPFSIEDLASAVRETLDRGAAGA